MVEDHVHLLARFGRTITQAEWAKELKRVSNLWLKERGRDYADFEWQGGYADFCNRHFLFGRALNHRKKLGCSQNLDALVVPQVEQVAVAADEVLGLPDEGTFQDGVIVRVGGDGFQCAWNGDELGEGANLIWFPPIW